MERLGDLPECGGILYIIIGDMMDCGALLRNMTFGIDAPRFLLRMAVREDLYKRNLDDTVGRDTRTGRLEVEEYYGTNKVKLPSE